MYALRRFSKLLKEERFTNIKDLIKRLNDERRGRMNHYALVKWGAYSLILPIQGCAAGGALSEYRI